MASAALQAAIDRYEASVKRLAAANQALAESQAPLVRQFKPGIADQPAASTGVNPLLMNWPRMRSPTLAEKFEFQDQDRFAKDNQAQGEGYIDHADKVYWEGLQAWDDPTEFARIGAMPDTSPERPTISAPPGARYETGEQQIISGAGPVSLSRPVTKPVERSQANVITRTEAPGAFSRAVGIAKNTGDPIEAVKELTEELSAPVRRRIIETEAGAVHGATAGLLPGFSKEDISKLKQFNWGKIEPSFMYDVGEFGGAVAPIMGISKVIAPISRLTGLGALETGTVLRSMNPVLRRQIPKLIEEGTLGVIYEGLRAKGDLSAIEALEHALYWAGIGQLGRVVGGVVKLLRGKPLTPKIPLEGEIKPAETPVAGAVPGAVLPEKPLPAAAPAIVERPQAPRPTPEPPVAKTGAKEPWEMTKKEYSSDYTIEQPQLPNKLISEIARTSDLQPRRGPILQEFDDLKKRIRDKGYDFVDAYHVSDASLESIMEEGLRGSALDYIGGATGNLRPSSVYAFLYPDEIFTGYGGLLGAKNKINHIVHFKIPISKLEKVYWDSNFNVSFGTSSSVRFQGDVPAEWVVSVKKYHAPTPKDYEAGVNRPIEYYHDNIIRKALSEGKPVPPEVLAEYPDLKPKGVPDAVQGKEIPKVGQAAKIGQAGQIQEVTPGQTPIVSRETLPRETPETPAGPGLTKAENAAMRRELNLDALPPAQREKFTEWEQAAKDARMDDDALNIAEDIIVKKRAHTPEEFAALSLKKTKVRSEHDLSLSIVEELKARGEMNAAALESAKADVLQGQLDQISRAAEIGGQETARAQVSRKIGFEADDEWSLTTVMTKAAEKKGRPLTTDDKQLIEQVSAAERRAYEKIMKERTKYELERDARLKTEAELVKAREEKTLTREQSRLGRVGSARAERADALKELERMGFAVHELTGVTLESSYQIGRVAASFFREGAANLDDAVRKTIERIPGLTDRQVWEALAAKSPKRIAAVRKEGTVALQQARSLAKARVNLENANNGIFAETAPRPPRTGEIVDLQHQLTRMRARAYRSGMTPGKLEKTQQKISELYDLLENHRSVLKKNGKIDATALSETRARIKDLEPTMGLDELLGRLNKQIETGIPHIPSIKPPPELPEYLLRAEVELRQARNQVRTTVNDLEPWTSRRYFQETMSALRTVKATLDASAILRQGLILSARRPGVALDAAGKGFHSVVSKHTAEQAMHAIESAPHHYKRILSDLYLSPLEGGSLVGREEMIGSNLFTKIPWLKKTYGRFAVEPFSRQMIVDLDLLRVGAFDQFLRAYPNATMQELKAWANWINVATGRGNLSQGAADWLSTTFFAPRFAMSRIQAPWMLFKYWKLPRVRNEIAKDMGATAGLLASGLGLAALGGATIGTDSREADFLKARFGDTRVDLFAGMQQPLRALMRIFTIATDEAGLTGNDLADNMKDIEPLEIMYRFLSYKTAPAIEQANWLLTGGFKGTGKNIMGEEEDIPVHLVKTLMPIVYQDIFDAIINDRVNSAVLGGTVADFFGAGANTYEDNESYYRREIMRAQEAGDFERAETLKAQWNIGHPDKQIVNVGMLGESTWPEIYKRLKDEGAGQDDIDHAREEWKAATKRRMEVKAKFMKERLKK